MPIIDDTTAKRIQGIGLQAQAALEDVFTGNPSYVKYLEAVVKLFAVHTPMNKGLAQELRDIAANLYMNYEERSEDNPDALTTLQGSIQMLLQEVINDPEFPISKWTISSSVTSESDNEPDTSVDTASLVSTIEEAMMEDSDDYSEYSENDFSNIEDGEDEEIDADFKKSIEVMIAETDAELYSAVDTYRRDSHHNEVDVDVDESPAESMQAFMAKEIFPKTFEQCLKTFRTESLRGNRSKFVSDTVDKLINDITSLYHSGIDKEVTVAALADLADACQGVIVSWGRLANMKIKSNDPHSVSIKRMIQSLVTLSESLSTLMTKTEKYLDVNRPSSKL